MIIVWSIVAIVTFIFEIATVGSLDSIWFTIGALVALVLACLQVAPIIQLLVFIGVSVGVLLLIRPLAVNYLRGNIVHTNTDRLIGQTAVAVAEIRPGEWGQVKVNKAVWSATVKEDEVIEVNERVKIIAIEGVKLIVRKIGN